jgi:ABC-type uncharacterized transport system auxiliary subunit
LLLLILIVSGCGRTYYRHYYTLDYIPAAEGHDNPSVTLPYTVEVAEFDISPTYDRPGIVIRNSMHQMRYSRYHLWPVRPQNAVQGLLLQHLREFHIFTDAKEEFLDLRPDYTVSGTIYSIELYSNPDLNRADIEMELSLRENETGTVVVTHRFSRFERIDTDNMAFFAKTISDILREENGIFIAKMISYFEEEMNDGQE